MPTRIVLLLTLVVVLCWPCRRPGRTAPIRSACGRSPRSPRSSGASTRPTTPGARATAASTCAGTAGQPVRSALPGRVSWAGVLAGRGVVVVDHGATRTTYEPVAATVRVGDQVDAGQRLGVLELAGSHCFPRACLHWGWLEGETYLDPLRLVGAGPVRLLPLWRDDPGQPGHAAAVRRGGGPSLTLVGCACW